MLRSIATHPAARGLADDAAVLSFGGSALVLTHDMMAQGVHWLEGAGPADVAAKLLAVNLSDLAAKGALPLGVLLGFTLGDSDWDRRFVAALGEECARFGAPLLGGDTIGIPAGAPRVLALTAIGRATCDPVPSRAGARPGDRLVVTGTIGEAMLGFLSDSGGEPAHDAALARFRRPLPRLAEGQALAPLAHALMDVSDGLLLDARRIAEASGVTVAIRSAAVPHSREAHARFAADPSLRERALRWGDDYELLAALPPGRAPPVPVTVIGEIVARGDMPLLVDGEAPRDGTSLGFLHGQPPL